MKVLPGANFKRRNAYSGELSIKQGKDGIRAAHENGLRLLSDAQILFSNKSYPSVVTLCLLSIEEFGKEIMLRAHFVETKREHSCFFWMRLRNSKTKTAFGVLPELCGADILNEEKILLAALDAANANEHIHSDFRDCSVYVDFVGNGHWQLPNEIINRKIAEHSIARATHIAEACEKQMSKFKMRYGAE